MPDLVVLTGGYSKTPVLQIGADIYCDTKRIADELETRFPQPTLYPDGATGHHPFYFSAAVPAEGKGKPAGRVRILEDTDGDGRYD